jgi:MFS family permease
MHLWPDSWILTRNVSSLEPEKPTLREQLAALRSLLANRDLGLFLASRLLATLSLRMVTVAVGWQLYEKTRSPVSLGLLGLATFAPALVLLLPSGALADRFDRRLVVGASFGLSAICAGSFAVFSLAAIQATWPYYAAVALLSGSLSFYRPSAASMLPALVPRERFLIAFAWNSSALKLGTLIGPALGGVLYLLGPNFVYLSAAAISALGAILTAAQRTGGGARGHDPKDAGLKRLLAGLGFVGGHPIVLGAITLDLFSSLLGGVTSLLPLYALDILAVGPAGLGALRSAPAVGAALLGLTFAFLPLNRRTSWVMFGTVALSGLATIAFGLSRNFPLSLVALAAMGAFDQISDTIRQTLVQMATPDSMRGRVNAVQQLSGSTSNGLGDVISGVTAGWIGAPPAIALGGLAAVAIGGLWAYLFPPLRRIDKLTEITP